MTAAALLERMLAATPPPPATTDIDALLAAFVAVHAMRQSILECAQPAGDPGADPAVAALRAELADREAAWQTALGAARVAVAEQRCNAGKLRAYGR